MSPFITVCTPGLKATVAHRYRPPHKGSGTRVPVPERGTTRPRCTGCLDNHDTVHQLVVLWLIVPHLVALVANRASPVSHDGSPGNRGGLFCVTW